MIEVRFLKSYIASRGPGISGVKGSVQTMRMNDSVEGLISAGVLELVKAEPAAKRTKATGKKGGETS